MLLCEYYTYFTEALGQPVSYTVISYCPHTLSLELAFSSHVYCVALLMILPRVLKHLVNATFLQRTLRNIKSDPTRERKHDSLSSNACNL